MTTRAQGGLSLQGLVAVLVEELGQRALQARRPRDSRGRVLRVLGAELAQESVGSVASADRRARRSEINQSWGLVNVKPYINEGSESHQTIQH